MVRIVEHRPRDQGQAFLRQGPPEAAAPSQNQTHMQMQIIQRSNLPVLPQLTQQHQLQHVLSSQIPPKIASNSMRYASRESISPPSRPNTTNSTRRGYDTRTLNELTSRLRDNERNQKLVVQKISAMETDVGENLRAQDNIIRDESHMRRLLEDHYRFLKVFVGDLKSSVVQVAGQVQLEREATIQAIDLYKNLQGEVSELEDTVDKSLRKLETDVRRDLTRLEEKVDKSVTAIVADFHIARVEINLTRDNVDRRATETMNSFGELRRDLQGSLGEFRKDVQVVDSFTRGVDNKVEKLKDYTLMSEGKLTSMLATQEDRLGQATRLLSDAILAVKSEETGEREKLQSLMKTKVEELEFGLKSVQSLHPGLSSTMSRVGTLENIQSSHSNALQSIQSTLSSLSTMLTQQFKKQEEVNGDYVKALLSVKDNIALIREETEGKRSLVHKEIEKAKQEIRQELEWYKEELKSEIRKVGNPIIVM